jgi:hypothetical protein
MNGISVTRSITTKAAEESQACQSERIGGGGVRLASSVPTPECEVYTGNQLIRLLNFCTSPSRDEGKSATRALIRCLSYLNRLGRDFDLSAHAR